MSAPAAAAGTAATVDYIVVQAGGKGTRLEHLTTNKPKALVPVENLPMIFHLFRKFPDKRFVVIADYHREVLRAYLAAFADVEYQVVDAAGSGTCGGVDQALALLPEGEPFMLVWSDLILPAGFELPAADHDWVGISRRLTVGGATRTAALSKSAHASMEWRGCLCSGTSRPCRTSPRAENSSAGSSRRDMLSTSSGSAAPVSWSAARVRSARSREDAPVQPRHRRWRDVHQGADR